MRLLLLLLLLPLPLLGALSGCASSPAAAPVKPTEELALMRWEGEGAATDPARSVVDTSQGGQWILVTADPTAPLSQPGWYTVVIVPREALLGKTAIGPLLSALDSDAAQISAYLRIDPSEAALDPDALKRELREHGFVAQTVAQDIVSGWFAPEDLGRFLRLPWVTALEVSRTVRLPTKPTQ